MTGATITCRAAVAWGPNQPLVIETVDVAPPKAREVRVKNHRVGLCHTDAYTLAGQDSEAVWPCILGHESIATVVDVGAGVTSVQPGDRVIPLYTAECRECKFCTSGKTNLCSSVRATQGRGLMPDETVRFTCKGQPVYHYMACSSLSEYSVLPEVSVAKVAHDAPANSCLLGCGITTGYGAATHTAKIEPGSSVAVFGLGTVGLSCVQGARACGAARVIGIDINPAKKDLALQFGATDFINPLDYPDTPIQQVIVDLTDGGVDYALESAGGNTKIMRAALESTHKGWGKAVIISVAAAGEEISARPFLLVTGRSWTGSAFGGVKGRTEMAGLVQKYVDGELKVDEYVTHTFTLEQVNEALQAMHEKQCVKVVLDLSPIA